MATVAAFFTPEEVAAVRADFALVWGRTEGGEQALEGELKRFNPAQFKSFDAVPFDCSPALNLIGLHPALIDFARAALETDDVRLYQNQVWAKFTGDADYDQPFHCDYRNHTLTAPSDDPRLNSITFILFFSDVSEAHGPTHYVIVPVSAAAVAPPEVTLSGVRRRRGAGGVGGARPLRCRWPAGQPAAPTASTSGTAAPTSRGPGRLHLRHRRDHLLLPAGRSIPPLATTPGPITCISPGRASSTTALPSSSPASAFSRPATHSGPISTTDPGARCSPGIPAWDMTPYREAMNPPP